MQFYAPPQSGKQAADAAKDDYYQGNPAEHYWSEYRRNYEHSLTEKLRNSRQTLKNEVQEP